MRKLWFLSSGVFWDLVRQRVFYSSLLGAVFLLGVGLLLADLSLVKAGLTVTSFGVSFCYFALVTTGAIFGGSLLSRERERRTLLLLLSQPVSPWQIYGGRVLGLLVVLGLSAVSIGVALFLILVVVKGRFHIGIGYGLAGAYLLGSVTACMALFFSLFFNATNSVLFSLGSTLLGLSVPQMMAISQTTQSEFLRIFLGKLAAFFPDLSFLVQLRSSVYGLSPDPSTSLLLLLHVLLILSIPTGLGAWLFGKVSR